MSIDNRAIGSVAVGIREAVKVFGTAAGAIAALDKVTLDIADNEFFTLLGPSGCGKTTLLRAIAGFEQLSGGTIHLFGEEIEGLPPNKRPVNTVFQHYALFPHMSVADNVAFGLRRLKRDEATVRRRVAEMLDLVQLGKLAARRPSELSGGQQQRVALARALAPQPKILLLDEPLSALDLKLRQAMRIELKQLQETTGITFIFVTHDQDEALSMSDRIAVMSAGRIEQVGRPSDIYERPLTRFVADFIGDSNLIEVTIESIDGNVGHCRTTGGHLFGAASRDGFSPGQTAHVSIRPERISLVPSGTAGALPCTIDRIVYLGTDTQVLVNLADGLRLTVRLQNTTDPGAGLLAGTSAAVAIPSGAVRLLQS